MSDKCDYHDDPDWPLVRDEQGRLWHVRTDPEGIEGVTRVPCTDDMIGKYDYTEEGLGGT